MDTSDYPSLPNLSRLHSRLARDGRRVEQIVDGHLDNVERLFRASTIGDWDAVAKVSGQLAALKPHQASNDVVHKAKLVSDELQGLPSGTRKPKHLADLLAACRELRKQ